MKDKILLIDTRQQAGKHKIKDCYFTAAAFRVCRICLPYGDYMLIDENVEPDLFALIAPYSGFASQNIIIPPKNKKAIMEALRAFNGYSVDTKRNMQELYNDLVQDHARFIRECERGGPDLCILTETTDKIKSVEDVARWRNPRAAVYYRNKARGYRTACRPPVTSKALAKSIQTVTEKHGVLFEFCTPEESAPRILKILTERAETNGSEKPDVAKIEQVNY